MIHCFYMKALPYSAGLHGIIIYEKGCICQPKQAMLFIYINENLWKRSQQGRWMDGWVDGWMGGWMGECSSCRLCQVSFMHLFSKAPVNHYRAEMSLEQRMIRRTYATAQTRQSLRLLVYVTKYGCTCS